MDFFLFYNTCMQMSFSNFQTHVLALLYLEIASDLQSLKTVEAVVL